MAQNINAIKGNIRAKGEDVLGVDMWFGEQTTASGLIISSDDATTRGIYPRWGRVYSKGPRNKDPYNEGDWILVSHGRWTRGLKVNTDTEELEVRKVELDSILAYSNEKPAGVNIGTEVGQGESLSIPSTFEPALHH